LKFSWESGIITTKIGTYKNRTQIANGNHVK